MASLSLDGCAVAWAEQGESRADVYFHFGKPGREEEERQGATNQGSRCHLWTCHVLRPGHFLSLSLFLAYKPKNTHHLPLPPPAWGLAKLRPKHVLDRQGLRTCIWVQFGLTALEETVDVGFCLVCELSMLSTSNPES